MNRRRVARGVTASFIYGKRSANLVSKRVHISTLKTIELRLMLSKNDPSIAAMDDREVRFECANRYGQWYMVTVNEHETL